jgi:pimeloyl-ACP methyl ester carboxylesterase
MHMPVGVGCDGWTMYVSLSPLRVRRLVVFVHGFRGRAVKTWMHFPELDEGQTWWTESDLLFVGYRSTRDTITGVAHDLRAQLERFYPAPHPEAVQINGKAPRKNLDNYDELIVVGHSLGGVIVRRAACDAAQEWLDAGKPQDRPALLTCKLRLFSPASAGFRPAGVLGVLEAAGAWRGLEMVLRASSAYVDLQRGSEILTQTRERSEALVRLGGFDALKAHIVWSKRDNVVVTERYTTDWVDGAWPDTSHGSVCKPVPGRFQEPWVFVETGQS